MPASRPLAVTGSYAPCVLYGSAVWRPRTDGRSEVVQELPSYALLCVDEGIHQVTTHDGTHRLHAGQACLLPPSFPHRHRLALEGRVCYVVFNVIAASMQSRGDVNALRLRPTAKPQPQALSVWGCDLPTVIPAPLLALSCERIRTVCELWWRDDVSRFRANGLLANWLCDLVLFCVSTTPGGTTVPERDPVDKAIAQLQGRPPPTSVAIWARSVGLDRTHFTRIFKAKVGFPPGDYLRQCRLRKAEDMLRATDWDMQGVSHEAGYRNVSALDHAFCTAHGCPPTLWRKRQRG